MAAWSLWQQYRRQSKKKLTAIGARQSLAELAAMGPQRAAAAIQHSIAKGWQGIFEPGAPRGNGPGNSQNDAGHLYNPSATGSF